jgi:hypothetical protein
VQGLPYVCVRQRECSEQKEALYRVSLELRFRRKKKKKKKKKRKKEVILNQIKKKLGFKNAEKCLFKS